MGTSNWQPKWWTHDKHGSGWERVKEALKRDWEQTKSDVHAGGRDLDQDVDDTVKQAVGRDVVPPPSQPNAVGGTPAKSKQTWNDVEAPVRYGYGARQQFGSEHAQWDDKLEGMLKGEWEEAKETTKQEWNDVKDSVRRGYDHSRS